MAYAIGDRSEEACFLLWQRIPKACRKGILYTDFWSAYALVLPQKRPQAKATDKRATPIKPHIERFNNTLRQRLGRFVRKTLSFSKPDEMHENCLLLFLHEHNKNCLN